MITITIPPELERPLEEEARRQKTTPETVAIDSLRMRFALPGAPSEKAPSDTLLGFLSDFVGVVSGTTQPLSEECGERFTEGMVEKQRRGRL